MQDLKYDLFTNLLQKYQSGLSEEHKDKAMNQDPKYQDGVNADPIEIGFLTQINKQLTQCLQQNTNLRMKYPQEPQRFYQSEQQMNSLLQKLSQLSQQHFPLIIQSNVSVPMIKILGHPNLDLAMQVVKVLFYLLQQQPQDDKLFEIYYRWAVWLIQNSLLQALVGILVKLDEESNLQQYEVSRKILKIVQILMNVSDSVYDLIAEDRQLFEYLANRMMPNFLVRHKTIDDNKYVSSDVLVALLSNSQKSQKTFSQFSGVEVLLQTISSYQTNFPTDPDEKQFLSNLLNSLSILLINYLLPQNKKSYHQMKGNYLMISFIRKKNQYSSVALKVIANSISSLGKADEVESCHGIINDGGLKYLFAVFKRKGFRGEDVDEQKAIDQNTLAILYCLIRSSAQVFKDRIEHKLLENSFQNLERFFELRNQFSQMFTKQTPQDQIQGPHEYLWKISQGLSFVETVDKVILVLIDKYPRLKGKIQALFKVYALKYKQIQATLNDHYKYLGIKQEKLFVEHLLGNNLILLKKLVGNQDQTYPDQGKLKMESKQ